MLIMFIFFHEFKKEITLYNRKIAKELLTCGIMYKNTKYRTEGHRETSVSLHNKRAFFMNISEQVCLDVKIGTNLYLYQTY